MNQFVVLCCSAEGRHVEREEMPAVEVTVGVFMMPSPLSTAAMPSGVPAFSLLLDTR